MNRLILIGNGFDLAHGLKTSVKDFGIHYFTKVFEKLVKVGNYEDDLVCFTIDTFNYLPFFDNRLNSTDFYKIKSEIDNNQNIKKVFNSSIMQLIYNNLDGYSWLNVENAYFKSLIQSVNPLITKEVLYKNQLFEKLKEKFLEYLKTENIKIRTDLFINDIYKSFISSRKVKDLPFKKALNIHDIDNIMFLNFNYTNTLELYLKKVKRDYTTDLIHIHGDLNEKFGKPVFGYGDELNKTYLTFEELNHNELYTHIKSFYYSLNSNYHKLTSFLESEDYEVYIYGHSCGITDRTLLNQIFEHDNCKLIKVFYYQKPDGSNDFVEKSYEIARNFKDKTKFRKRLFPLDKSTPMLQNKA